MVAVQLDHRGRLEFRPPGACGALAGKIFSAPVRIALTFEVNGVIYLKIDPANSKGGV